MNGGMGIFTDWMHFLLPKQLLCPGIRSAVSGKLQVPHMQTSFGDRSFTVSVPHTWNNLSDAIRDLSQTFSAFTKLLKTYLFV